MSVYWNDGPPGALSTHSWGLCLNTSAKQSLTETMAGVQTTFASPCTYTWDDLYDSHAINNDSEVEDVYLNITGGAEGVICMVNRPHMGLLKYVLEGAGTGNPAIKDLQPWNEDNKALTKDLTYSIRTSALMMTITNNGTHTVTLKEYKCVFRKPLPNNYFTPTGWDYDVVTSGHRKVQPHLDLYNVRLASETAAVHPGVADHMPWYGNFLPGATPFRSRAFCRFVKIVGVRTIVLNGGQESKSYWKRNKPMTVNLADAGDPTEGSGDWCKRGSYFFLYTALPSRAFRPGVPGFGISSTLNLQAEAKVTYEVTVTGADHKQWYNMDYRQVSLGKPFAAANFHMRNPFNLGDTVTAPAPTGPDYAI